MKLSLAVLVDKKYEPLKWANGETQEDKEIRQRFLQKRIKHIYPRKLRNKTIKLYGKKNANLEGYLKTYESYDFLWKSFSALKKHLIANSESIELIRQLHLDQYIHNIARGGK